MKLVSNTLLAKLSNTELLNLTASIEEKLDLNYGDRKQATFNRVNLWNINKNRRSFSRRKFL